MTTLEIVMGILLCVCATALIVVVLLQDSKSHNMSGVISGGAENLFGQSKGKAISNKLNKVTIVLAILLVVIVLVFYVQQFVKKPASQGDDTTESSDVESSEVVTDEVTPESVVTGTVTDQVLS
ncbi:MAG: preprotein translocase subunit SecG [Clostridia bacterium]|nr:preprotein translocase subunit SecG [Clostridia bacterium]